MANASISNVISLSLEAAAQAALSDNPNICSVITGEQGVLSSSERYRAYTTAAAVESDWGSSHEITQHANVFFQQSPNPVNAGGRFIAGYYRETSENVAASAAVLNGGSFDVIAVIAALQQISDGEFDIDVDGGTENIASLDFQAVVSLANIVSVIDTALAGATCTENANGDGIDITSDTTGASSTLTITTDPAGGGTYVGELLAIAANTGAVLTQGAAASVLGVETPAEGAAAIKAVINYKGFIFAKAQSAANIKLLATFAQANDCLYYEVFNDTDELNLDVTETPWFIKLASQKNTRMIFRLDGNRKFGTGYMARAHVVNFNAENSALTMNLKEIIGVVSETLSQTQIDSAKNVGLDVYVSIKNTPVVLTSGANGYTDTQYNLLAFVDALETDMFNVLKLTGTKIPQTTKGVNTLLDQVEKTSNQYVRAGVFAPGTWTSPDFFGDQDAFNRGIEENGFFWIAGRLSDQSAGDRAARKSPVIQGAVKFSGAFHSVEIIVKVNE